VSESLKSTLEREWHRTWSRDNDNGRISISLSAKADHLSIIQCGHETTTLRKQVQNRGSGKASGSKGLNVGILSGTASSVLFRDAQNLALEMGCLHPSWNTDQGVKQTRKGEDFYTSTISRTEREVARPMVCTQHECPTPTGPHVGLSLSVPVWTRKVVNYAWTRWSPGKPRWRPVAVLTCKSLVWFGYRSERLIEPPSSWFTSKFPSG